MAYVYQHIRLDKNEVFYVGIANDKNYERAHLTYGRSRLWSNIVNKTEFLVEIIYDNISFEECKVKEVQLIKQYGRIDIGTGCLANLTFGGEGVLGYKPTEDQRKRNGDRKRGKHLSEEHRNKLRQKMLGRQYSAESIDKMRIAAIGNKKGLGHKKSDEVKKRIGLASASRRHTAESRKKISEANMVREGWSKGVIVAYQSNEQIGEFKNTSEAAKELGVWPQNICKVLAGKRNMSNGYFFKRKSA